ncbi:helix-turn-helix domain-containing protein [Bacillus subtilis]|nr:helix-turn-helix domain-containing protein [Bacillus subtilis]MEC3633332.1 helix-turn-helix domain-containing protein [Bacillus subtilis]MEC3644073.1 helix-turn-helix domain-containing protein [Bacillus subtilis]MEC3648543.1 helix-turn-helix domain-containing protein [Bacillus subtilis]MEC3700162.1 helix-turn-helix domain-containing protein [Bacillus subtilis]
MGTRVSYPVEVKQKAVEMRLAGVPMKEIMEKLKIKNKTQIQTWVRWHKAGVERLLESNTLTEKGRSMLPI